MDQQGTRKVEVVNEDVRVAAVTIQRRGQATFAEQRRS